ncbi:MAG: pseudouridine synthase [Pyrinomonadaceae bacterium]
MQERLNKLLAQAGIASRRAAEELIMGGMVSVNGEIVTTLGTKADPEIDHIKVNGKLINKKLEKRENVYILLNKPKGYLSSVADPKGRKLVTDLVKGYGKLHPVGRLDYNTEGLLILTNDGEFTNVVASSKTVPKTYEVKVKGLPNQNAINKLRRGIVLDDGFKTAPAEIKELKPTENNGWFEVTLFEGHNQQIRKMFDAIGNSVVKLRRIAIGHIKDDRIPVGAYRELDAREVKEFINPSVKSAKKPAESKFDAEKPKLRPNSRYVAPKKSKAAKTAKSANAPKPKKSLKDALKGKFSDRANNSEKTFSRTETTQTRFKKTANSESGFAKFKSKSARKPKR